MKLRQKSKRDQALDAVASMAKTWSEWRLGEKVSKTAAKGAKKAGTAAKSARKSRSSGGAGKSSRVKVAGAIALLGGLGAAVAKKLTGGKAEPLYTPPAPVADMAPAPAAPVVADDLTQPPAVNEPMAPSAEPAGQAPATTGPGPVSVEDVAADVSAAAGAAETTLGAEDPGVVPASQPASPSQEHVPEPDDLLSGTAPPAGASGDDDAPADEATERP